MSSVNNSGFIYDRVKTVGFLDGETSSVPFTYGTAETVASVSFSLSNDNPVQITHIHLYQERRNVDSGPGTHELFLNADLTDDIICLQMPATMNTVGDIRELIVAPNNLILPADLNTLYLRINDNGTDGYVYCRGIIGYNELSHE